jgi:hypothetical protein
MAKKIQKSDISEEDVFKGVRDSAKNTLDIISELNEELKKTAQTLKDDISKTGFGNAKELQAFNKAAKETTKIKQDAQKLAQQEQKAKEQLQKANQKLIQLDERSIKAKIKDQEARKQQNKEIRTTIQAETELTKAQNKELGTLQKLEFSNRKLRAERAKLNLETKQGQRRLKEINAEIDKNNNKIKGSADAMKKQRLNVGNYTSAIGGLRNMLAQLGLAFGVFSTIRDSFNVVREFDQAQANLASVLGVNRDEMTALTAQAKELGATTKFTASQVSELQLEFAKLGFTQSEIQNVTKATLQLAAAAGTDLGEAATVAGSTIRGFGLSTTETQRVVDVMAKSFSSSSLDMAKFSTAMSAVAPVAKSAGLNIERTTALLGTLTDRGIDASTAGTGLRNIFLELTKKGLTFEEAMNQINNASDKSGAALDLFGKRGATLGVILAENQDSVGELETKLYDAGGAAGEMADKQLDTLNGAIDLLRSAWEGLILKFEEGTGAFGLLKDFILFLANNLEAIVKGFVTLGTALGVYKLINLTTKAFRGLTLAMSANPIGLVAAAIAGLIVALKSFINTMSTAEKAQKAVNDVREEAAKATVKEKTKLQDLLRVARDEKNSKEDRKKAIEQLNRISPEYLGNLTLENIKTEEGVTAINRYIAALDRKALEQAISNKKTELAEQLLEAETKTAENSLNWLDKSALALNKVGAAIIDYSTAGMTSLKDLNEEFGKEVGTAKRQKLIDDIQAQIDALDELTQKKIESGELDLDDIIGGTGAGAGDGAGKGAKKIKSLLREIEDEQIKRIKNEEERQRKTLEVQAQRRIEDLKKVKANAEEKARLQKEIEESLQFDLDKIAKEYEKKRTEAIKKLGEEIRKSTAEAVAKEPPVKIEEDDLLKRDEFAKAYKKKRLELLNDVSKTTEQVESELLAFEVEQLKEKIKLREKYGEDATDLQIELAEKERNLRDKEMEEEKAAAAQRREIIQAVTDFAIQESERRIEAIDKEIEAANKQADNLRELAAQGNIEASESIAEQQRIIAEANRAREKELQRQQRIKLASTIYDTYQSKIEAGSAEPLAETIRDTTLLQAFISSLPAFEEGTEDTGKNGQGIDGKGGFHAILHPNERVMTKGQNAMIGDLTNVELARLAQEYNAGQMIHKDGAKQLGGAWESTSIVNKLNELQRAIESKPETNIELERIIDGTMKITRQTKQGNNVIFNRYKVRK